MPMHSNLTQPETDLSCTYDEAERNHLLDGLRMSVEQRVAWFEEATALVYMMEERAREKVEALYLHSLESTE